MSEPVRVAQILNRMDSGGIEAVVMNYYRRMDRSRVQFDVYLCEDSSFPQRAELEAMGAGIFLIPPYTKVAAYQRALQTAFRQRGYGIVHAHLSTMSVFPLFAAFRAGVPVRICHNHSTAHWGEGKKTLLKYLLRPFARLFATELFACGEEAGRWMYGEKRVRNGRVRVMPNAIETERFRFDAVARQRLRAELGIPQDAFVVGHVGRFTYAKNHGFLLEIFAAVRKRRPDARLLLVGEGELEAEVRQKAQALGLAGQVVFAGARADVEKVYAAMDVFCLPSRYEGFPVVVLEARANGLPCAVSDQVTGELCRLGQVERLPLGSAAAWAGALLERRRDEGGLPGMYDIGEAAAALAAFYEQRDRENR